MDEQDYLDAGSAACVTLLFPLLRWGLNVYLYEPLALRVLRPLWGSGGAKVTPERAQLDIVKFSECMWKLGVYALFTALGVASVWRQPWVLDPEQLWLGWPDHAFTLPMQALYQLELGFYISSVVMILCWEVRRKDFAAMFSHHIATVLLVGASLHYRCWRVGVLIMLLHDACDVLMEAAKLAKYSRREALSVAIFGTFTAAWAALRLAFFPLVVLRSTLYDAGRLTALDPRALHCFNGLLLGLLGLHCYWFSLILRIVWMAVTTGQADDVREDED